MLSDPTDQPKLTQLLLPRPILNADAAPSAAQAPMHAKLVVVLLLLLAIQNLWALMVPFYVFVPGRGDAPPERPVA